ncbi:MULTISPECIES: hypothetical protein [Nonomuraea]|uniref:Uncharacterized protein n=1 Tax=Nonomuraea mangrovi TaxID=2316207 RepID=A0ABW4SMC3_9ACTN
MIAPVGGVPIGAARARPSGAFAALAASVTATAATRSRGVRGMITRVGTGLTGGVNGAAPTVATPRLTKAGRSRQGRGDPDGRGRPASERNVRRRTG